MISSCADHIEEKNNIPVNFKTIFGSGLITYIDTIIENKEVIFCLVNKVASNSAKEKFYSSPEIIFYKLSNSNTGWKKEIERPVLKQEFSYLHFFGDIEMLSIEKNPYIYFVYLLSPMGNASDEAELHFALYSLNDYNLTVLPYRGNPVYDENSNFISIRSDDTINRNARMNPRLLSFLQEKQRSSELIYKPNARDADINDIINYEKKWAMDNPDMPKIYNLQDTLEHKMNITYYEESLFAPERSSFEKIENDEYIVVSLFRNNVLAYDIKRKKYFPVWIESYMHGCNKSISFLNDSMLIINSEEIAEQRPIRVNLLRMTYRFH